MSNTTFKGMVVGTEQQIKSLGGMDPDVLYIITDIKNYDNVTIVENNEKQLQALGVINRPVELRQAAGITTPGEQTVTPFFQEGVDGVSLYVKRSDGTYQLTGTVRHSLLSEKDSPSQHPIAAIEGLEYALAAVRSIKLYPQNSNSAVNGTLSYNPPTGVGTTIPAWGGNLNTTMRQLWGFTTVFSDAHTIILPNNVYNSMLRFRNLSTNRDYQFRYVLGINHPSLGGDVVLYDNITTPFNPDLSSDDRPFSTVNINTTTLDVPAGAVATWQIWGRVLNGTGTAALLLYDEDNPTFLMRNEEFSQQYAKGVITAARGFDETQEEFNKYSLGASYQDVIYLYSDVNDNVYLDDVIPILPIIGNRVNMDSMKLMIKSANPAITGNIVLTPFVDDVAQTQIIVPVGSVAAEFKYDFSPAINGKLKFERDSTNPLDTLRDTQTVSAVISSLKIREF